LVIKQIYKYKTFKTKIISKKKDRSKAKLLYNPSGEGSTSARTRGRQQSNIIIDTPRRKPKEAKK